MFFVVYCMKPQNALINVGLAQDWVRIGFSTFLLPLNESVTRNLIVVCDPT